jgi:hypothetical protein
VDRYLPGASDRTSAARPTPLPFKRTGARTQLPPQSWWVIERASLDCNNCYVRDPSRTQSRLRLRVSHTATPRRRVETTITDRNNDESACSVQPDGGAYWIARGQLLHLPCCPTSLPLATMAPRGHYSGSRLNKYQLYWYASSARDAITYIDTPFTIAFIEGGGGCYRDQCSHCVPFSATRMRFGVLSSCELGSMDFEKGNESCSNNSLLKLMLMLTAAGSAYYSTSKSTSTRNGKLCQKKGERHVLLSILVHCTWKSTVFHLYLTYYWHCFYRFVPSRRARLLETQGWFKKLQQVPGRSQYMCTFLNLSACRGKPSQNCKLNFLLLSTVFVTFLTATH